MNKVRMLLAMLLVLGALTGCGGGGGGGGPTTPSGNSETEPNDFTPQSIGTLAGADIVWSGSSAGQGDVDLYTVTITGATNLLVSLNWSGSNDLELSISNASGIFVRTVDTASHPESCTIPGLAPGTYTIRVGSFASTATSYSLTVGAR
ncbi:MAG: PPC domain-containing protein [Candidatus Eisenbacteria bacterium]